MKWFNEKDSSSIEQLHKTLEQVLLDVRAGYQESNREQAEKEIESEFKQLFVNALITDGRFDFSGESAANAAEQVYLLSKIRFKVQPQEFKKLVEVLFPNEAA